MTEFIKNPNLPDNKVRALICGSSDERILSFFGKECIDVLCPDINQDIPLPVSNHADMSCLYLGNGKIITDKRQTNLKSKLAKMGMTVFETAEKIAGEYPSDIRLNVALISDIAIGNFRHSDPVVSDAVGDKRFINVRQGYTKCSVLVLNRRAIITDDESVYKAASETGVDTLLISKGDIMLDGYDYGFIGGASGKISSDTVLFFGNIERHRDFNRIKSFLEKYNLSYLCTDYDRLRDIGGIIPLTEEV